MSKIENIFHEIFQGKYSHYFFIILLFLIITLLFFKIAFQGYIPEASDTMQWRTSAQCMIEYNENNEDQALWNSNIFSGMPGYLISFGSKYPFVNNLRQLTDKLVNWRVFLLFMAALGIYVLMLSLGFSPLIAFISAIAFALSSHFLGLIEIGHNTKFKSLIYIPWIFFAIEYLRKNRNILGMGLAALFIIGQLRENHPQISYYTFLMLGIYWIFHLVWSLKDKEFKKFIIFSLMFLAILFISFLAVAQPYLSTLEYGEYTIRGGSEGVGKSYATSWSFHPAEMLSFIIPDFFGGISPDYWGWMPFTQTSMYMSIIILALAIVALFFNKKRLVKILGTVSLITLFMSFGKHFPLFSNFLLKYLPYFNKFRVPSMILILLQFAIVVLAGYGLQVIIVKFKNKDQKFQNLSKKMLLGSIAIIILFIFLDGVFQNMKYTNASEMAKIKDQYVSHYGRSEGLRYAARHLEQLKKNRHDLLMKSGYIAFSFLIIFWGATYLFGLGKIGQKLYLIIVGILVIVDLSIVNSKFLQNLQPQEEIKKSYQKSAADKFFLEDQEEFRIYPLGSEFGQNKWAYYNQTIGGYHGAKLQRYQEIIENCLHAELENRIPINWNIVNMLNAKYVLFGQKLPLENLEYRARDREQKLTVYENLDYLPRAWFVKDLELISEKEIIWKRLNQKEFQPSKTAIVEEKIAGVSQPKNAKVSLEKFSLHELQFKTENDSTSFLTISEIYYPAGWKAFIDGKETPIYPANYILRGIKVPAGKHEIKMVFAPEIYALSLKLSLIGLVTTFVFLIIGLFFYYKKNYQGKIVYVLKK